MPPPQQPPPARRPAPEVGPHQMRLPLPPPVHAQPDYYWQVGGLPPPPPAQHHYFHAMYGGPGLVRAPLNNGYLNYNQHPHFRVPDEVRAVQDEAINAEQRRTAREERHRRRLQEHRRDRHLARREPLDFNEQVIEFEALQRRLIERMEQREHQPIQPRVFFNLRFKAFIYLFIF